MLRGQNCGLLILVAAAAVIPVHARPAPGTLLARFLAIGDPAPTQFRALRHLEANNDRFDARASIDVWTEGDRAGAFRYQIVAHDGSEYIRDHVLIATLETERKMWASGEPDAAAVTPANYTFEDGGRQSDGLLSLIVKPRRKDVLLVDGSIFLNPGDGDLVRLEGRLAKSPSFWTRGVRIVRWYRRLAGVRMPVSLESIASIRIAGESTFRMTYDYESINGQRVGTPAVRARK